MIRDYIIICPRLALPQVAPGVPMWGNGAAAILYPRMDEDSLPDFLTPEMVVLASVPYEGGGGPEQAKALEVAIRADAGTLAAYLSAWPEVVAGDDGSLLRRPFIGGQWA